MIPSHVVDACLSHIDSNSMRAAYYRENVYGPRVKVMEEWSDFIDLQLKAVVTNFNEHSPLIEVITAIIS
ncbi:hypothetical protein VCO01S_31150 [Vibrio comitans NBRC 102076]|uniref:Integrase n=2 Tax=Vibrio comitans TaxID=413401 RepID=A0A4Y3IS35_9VIBR|nr:hypothetical protein VCO01S_31150 [Vibrio comitans NBRC 102076]